MKNSLVGRFGGLILIIFMLKNLEQFDFWRIFAGDYLA